MSVVTSNENEAEPSSGIFRDDETIVTRNYTGPREKYAWWLLARWSKDWKAYSHTPYYTSKQDFRTRRVHAGSNKALRIRFANSDDIGVFMKVTNSYALLGGEEHSEHVCSLIRSDLSEIPVINTSLEGCRVIGRMCVGNKNGLLLPEATYDTELQHIRNELPDSVKVETIEDRLSALGNVIACNDHVAIIHPDLDKESEEIIADTLQVEVFRHMIANNALVGSYCVLSNQGGLVCADINNSELENLSSLLQVPLVAGTINRGNKTVASGLVVSDHIAYAGMKTTSSEFTAIDTAFGLTPARWF
jgi:translation initiation factor 6